jgi:hypothetical protein
VPARIDRSGVGDHRNLETNMKTLLLLLAALTFDIGRVTVATNPGAAASAATAITQRANPIECPDCPEWLCRILCGWMCEPCPQGACQQPSCAPRCCGG